MADIVEAILGAAFVKEYRIDNVFRAMYSLDFEFTEHAKNQTMF